MLIDGSLYLYAQSLHTAFCASLESESLDPPYAYVEEAKGLIREQIQENRHHLNIYTV